MPSFFRAAAMALYETAWLAATPFLSKNKRLAEGLDQRTLKVRLPKSDIWIQAASAGESYLARTILKSMRPTRPTGVLATSNTSQGMGILNEAARDQEIREAGMTISTACFPFDRPSIMKRAVADVSPSAMVLLESEIWPGLLSALKNENRKILIVNGRINQKSLDRYQAWPSLWKSLAPDRILAVSDKDAERFATLFGEERVEVAPNIKFDQAGPALLQGETVAGVEKLIVPGAPFLALASVREEEEPLIEPMIERVLKKKPDAVIGLFPRHMHRIAHWRDVFDRRGHEWRLRSKADSPASPGEILLWDTFGELTAAYRSAKAVFVGGSLAPLGGQNFLEPLTFGVVPVTGPSWFNFHWIGREIMDSGLVKTVGDWKEAADALVQNLLAPPSGERIRAAALAYIEKRQGGARRAARLIESCIEPSAPSAFARKI